MNGKECVCVRVIPVTAQLREPLVSLPRLNCERIESGMAPTAHLVASSPLLLPRAKQPWTPPSGLEFSPSLPTRVAGFSTGYKSTGVNFAAWNQQVPADARFRTKKWGTMRFGIQRANHQWQCSVQENPRILQARSMEETYDALARHLLSAVLITEPDQKYVVGIAGSPGAGKSTVAKEVAARLNALWLESQGEKTGADIAVAVPMDGFHLYRWQLDAMEDPIEAHARRGAHWTFDPASLVKNLQQLRSQGWAHLPSFDHGVGDPVEKDIFVSPTHRVVVVEGNYLLMEEGEWTGLAQLFDERWYVDIDIDEAMTRVEKRHVSTGKTPDYAKQRVVYNDRPNAELIALTKRNADLIIPSISVC